MPTFWLAFIMTWQRLECTCSWNIGTFYAVLSCWFITMFALSWLQQLRTYPRMYYTCTVGTVWTLCSPTTFARRKLKLCLRVVLEQNQQCLVLSTCKLGNPQEKWHKLTILACTAQGSYRYKNRCPHGSASVCALLGGWLYAYSTLDCVQTSTSQSCTVSLPYFHPTYLRLGVHVSTCYTVHVHVHVVKD